MEYQNNLKNKKYNYKMVFTYDGTLFFGSQIQPSNRSVEEKLTKALNLILNKKDIKLYMSGRTDKGVHAINQVANFFTNKKLDNLEDFKRRINKIISEDIFIKSIQKVSNSFSARFSATKKEYYYLINIDENYDPLRRNYELYKGKYITLSDINRLKEVSKLFIGTHNFINFTSKEVDETDNFIRTIYDIKIKLINNKKIIKISFIGNGFMRYEIRKIVGTFLAYLENKIDLTTIKSYLDDKNNLNNRKIINYQADSKALYLYKVYYK